jgi:hypothetical protein
MRIAPIAKLASPIFVYLVERVRCVERELVELQGRSHVHRVIKEVYVLSAKREVVSYLTHVFIFRTVRDIAVHAASTIVAPATSCLQDLVTATDLFAVKALNAESLPVLWDTRLTVSIPDTVRL